ncbi:MAG: OmpH family outer membrane protein [Candidatus Dadabacteria bacterium]|nr:OmpH family outer membrane protein [Candidatus Dadabacteria bacterium]MYE61026.1 OmpH family outer membrane protein [Candidatus Dadabacteria bacterium]MYI72960.1 OmpH family outer membrane protein [Candidatus Dadabacteria bacterium]
MRKCLLLAAGFFMLFTFSAYAQQKIAYIDIKQVIRDSKAGKAANTSFQKEVEAKRAVIEQKRKALEDMRQDVIQNGAVMSESKRRNLAETIEKKQKDLDRTREDIRIELQRKDLELTQNVLKDIEAIVNKIGQQEKFGLIVEKTEAGILYGSSATDITNKVISVYDASR